MIEQGFTQQEIDESKSYMIGAISRQLETNAAIASFLLTVETFNLGLDYDERLPGLIGAITKDAADAAAKKLLDPKRATIAVAGPWTQPSAPAPSPAPPPATEAAPPSAPEPAPAPAEPPLPPAADPSNLV